MCLDFSVIKGKKCCIRVREMDLGFHNWRTGCVKAPTHVREMEMMVLSLVPGVSCRPHPSALAAGSISLP